MKLLIPLMMLAATFASFAHERRLRVPEYFSCERNFVTSWHGIVSSYSRDKQSLSITVSTDADTREVLRLNFTGNQELMTQLYLHGREFTPDDWHKIESSPGELKSKMPVTIWLCEDRKTKPLINWRPRMQGSP